MKRPVLCALMVTLCAGAPICAHADAPANADILASDEVTFERAQGLVTEIMQTFEPIESSTDDLVVLFGIPSDEQRRAVHEAGERIVALATEAERVIARAVEDADRDGASDAKARDGFIQARAGHLPCRLARGALLAAASTADISQQREFVAQARAALGRVRATSTWITLETALLQGIALMIEGDARGAQDRFDAARTSLSRENAGPATTSEFLPAITFGLVLTTLEERGWSAALTAARTLTDREPFMRAGSENPVFAPALADVRFQILAVRAKRESTRGARAKALDEAFANYSRLVRVFIDAGADGRSARALAERKAGEAYENWMERKTLPGVALAGIVRLRMDDEQTRGEGIEIARIALAGDADRLGMHRRTIVWELAQALASIGDTESFAESCRLSLGLARADVKDIASLTLACSTAEILLGREIGEDVRADAIGALRLAHERSIEIGRAHV